MIDRVEPSFAARGRRAARDDDEEDQLSPLRIITMALIFLARVVMFVVFVLFLLWAAVKFLGQFLPDGLRAVLENILGFFGGIWDGVMGGIAGLTCGVFGVFCAAPAPVDPVPVDPAPSQLEVVQCAAGEIAVDADCLCEAGRERDETGLCVLALIDEEPAPIVAPEPEPEPVPATLTWLMPPASGGEPSLYWRYNKVEFAGDTRFLQRNQEALCGAGGLIAIGTASADNDTAGNDALAKARANRLAQELSLMCGKLAPPTWRANLGGYQGGEDRDGQRIPVIAVLTAPSGDGPSLEDQLPGLLCAEARGGLLPTGAALGQYAAFARDNVCANGWGERLIP